MENKDLLYNADVPIILLSESAAVKGEHIDIYTVCDKLYYLS